MRLREHLDTMVAGAANIARDNAVIGAIIAVVGLVCIAASWLFNALGIVFAGGHAMMEQPWFAVAFFALVVVMVATHATGKRLEGERLERERVVREIRNHIDMAAAPITAQSALIAQMLAVSLRRSDLLTEYVDLNAHLRGLESSHLAMVDELTMWANKRKEEAEFGGLVGISNPPGAMHTRRALGLALGWFKTWSIAQPEYQEPRLSDEAVEDHKTEFDHVFSFAPLRNIWRRDDILSRHYRHVGADRIGKIMQENARLGDELVALRQQLRGIY